MAVSGVARDEALASRARACPGDSGFHTVRNLPGCKMSTKKPAEVLESMQFSSDTIRDILEHRLQQADIENLLHTLSDGERAQLFFRVTEFVRRASALIDIGNRVNDTLSLDILFPRLIEVVSETLNAERGSLFLYDPDTLELFSRVMQESVVGEVRFPVRLGIAGGVFASGESEIIEDAYADARFNREIDEKTGFVTRNILCVPIKSKSGDVIGITQALNKRDGAFDADDQRLLEALSQQVSALSNAQLHENVARAQREETLLLEVSSAIASEIHINPLLETIVNAATRLLDAERGSLFMYEPGRNELYSKVAGGVVGGAIRISADAGLTGEAFRSNVPIIVADTRTDERFNPEIDQRTGFRTRNMLVVPMSTTNGTRVGVIEVLNKARGPFTQADARRLAALGAQAAVSIENAMLFEQVSESRSYNEDILRSMSNGVLTLDTGGTILKANESVMRIVRSTENQLLGKSIA